MRTALSVFVLLFSIGMSGAAWAVDGVLEINETCALSGGCFDGDSAGWPVTIDRAGSYRLTGNLYTGSVNITAIQIATSNVNLDLNGFEISCRPVPFFCLVTGSEGYGVVASNQTHITIRNGTIRRMSLGAIFTGERAQIENINASLNGDQSIAGIVVGDNSTVRGCTVSTSGGHGISTGFDSLILGNVAHDNGNRGISANGRATIKDNVARENSGYGIGAGTGSTVVNNTSNENVAGGILATGGSNLIGNTAYDNGGLGFSLNGIAGYANSVLTSNNGNSFGSNANPEVSGGQQLGTNLCGSDTVCP